MISKHFKLISNICICVPIYIFIFLFICICVCNTLVGVVECHNISKLSNTCQDMYVWQDKKAFQSQWCSWNCQSQDLHELSWESCKHVWDMLWFWPNVVKFRQHLSFVETSTFQRILYVGHTRQWPREKILALFIFIAFLDSLWQEEYIAQKKKKHVQKYVFLT